MTDTPADVADKAISFIEDVLDYPLEPWQATTLRAILTYPVATRFVSPPPPQGEPLPGMVYIQRDGKWTWEKPVQRKGFESDHVVMDEGCTCFGTGYESYCPVHSNRRV